MNANETATQRRCSSGGVGVELIREFRRRIVGEGKGSLGFSGGCRVSFGLGICSSACVEFGLKFDCLAYDELELDLGKSIGSNKRRGSDITPASPSQSHLHWQRWQPQQGGWRWRCNFQIQIQIQIQVKKYFLVSSERVVLSAQMLETFRVIKRCDAAGRLYAEAGAAPACCRTFCKKGDNVLFMNFCLPPPFFFAT